MVERAVSSEPVSTSNSLLSREIAGNFAISEPIELDPQG
jgi:hypothetical protein